MSTKYRYKDGRYYGSLQDEKDKMKMIKQYIDEIIIIKNDELFGFIGEDAAVEKWSAVNEKLDEEIDEYREVLTSYLQKLNNSETCHA